MDWHADPADAAALASLERELTTYLRRHGQSDSDFDTAEREINAALASVAEARESVWVSLDWSEDAARLDIASGGAVVVDGDGREKVSIPLPVRRERVLGSRAPRHRADALPSPEETNENGVFGREAFLRALVVQLAEEIEREHGPDAAEAAIAQVGTDVGGRMEDEYRRARGIVERLTPQEMGDLYVRLKHAIDGDFRVLEATEERIVLANRRCPFGDVVKRAPGLCRMTSSVFGGIAARNAGASTVELERRIAVGDPECHVTVWLGPRSRGVRYGHVYAPREEEGEEPLRVVLAENYAFLRDPLAEALAGSAIEVVSHANTRQSLLLKVEKHRPDVAIIDFREADTEMGIGAAAEIRGRHSEVGVLVLAERLEAGPARDLLGTGSDGVGYLLKDRLSQAELVSAIRRVAEGAAALDPDIVPELVGATDPLGELTPREREVLELVSEGFSNQAIADELVVTKRAVEKHVKSIFRKLGLRTSGRRERRVLAARAFSDWGSPARRT